MKKVWECETVQVSRKKDYPIFESRLESFRSDMSTKATGTTWKFNTSPLKVTGTQKERIVFQASFFRGFCCSNFRSLKSRLIGILTKRSFNPGCLLLLGRGSKIFIISKSKSEISPWKIRWGIWVWQLSTSSDTTRKPERHLFAGKGVTFSEPGWRKDNLPWNRTNWYQELPFLKGLTFSTPFQIIILGIHVCFRGSRVYLLGFQTMQEAISQVASW